MNCIFFIFYIWVTLIQGERQATFIPTFFLALFPVSCSLFGPVLSFLLPKLEGTWCNLIKTQGKIASFIIFIFNYISKVLHFLFNAQFVFSFLNVVSLNWYFSVQHM